MSGSDESRIPTSVGRRDGTKYTTGGSVARVLPRVVLVRTYSQSSSSPNLIFAEGVPPRPREPVQYS